MNQYKDRDSAAKIVRQACWALSTLTADEVICRALLVSGGDSAVIHAMLTHRWILIFVKFD
jgi:hypothetical protein